MDPQHLVNGVLRSVLGGGRKRSGRALRYLSGGRHSIWSSPTTLLTAAGVAWGIYETLTNKGVTGATGAMGASGATGAMGASGTGSPGFVVPPLPNTAPPVTGVSDEVL